jgi:hypothetical protein
LDPSLRLCAFAREKYLFFRHIERSKKINSSAAADAKKITRAKPTYRRQDAKTQRIFLCVMSFAVDENKEKNLAKQESR